MELTINPIFAYGAAKTAARKLWRLKHASGSRDWIDANRTPVGHKYVIANPVIYSVARRQVPAIDNSTEQIFDGLRQKWEADTAFDSSVARKSMHPAYQRIIGMGLDVLPLILRDLRNRRAHWFWALHAITGDDPAQNQTTVDGAVDAWVRWGKERGLI